MRLELVETYPLSVLKEAARIAAGRKTAKDIGAVFVSILRDGEATEAAAKRATADAAARVADVSRVADVAARAADADAAKVNADRETAVILKADAAAVRAALVTVGAALPHVTSIIRAGTDPAADSAAVIRAARSPLVRGDVAALLSRS